MYKSKYRLLLILCANIALFWILERGGGTLPPLGKVLSPFSGVWMNGALRGPKHLNFAEIHKKVEVQWDSNGVPHLFAQSDNDLYFAQGFLHAKDRLFQMDLQTRVGAARLSELLGSNPKAKSVDLFFLSIGMREAARRALVELKSNPATKLMIESYTKGVNAFISGLTYASLPVEYKLLDRWPSAFEEMRVANFLKLMSFNLAGKSFDLELSRIKKEFGHELVEDLFRDIPSFMIPIIPDEDLSVKAKGVSDCCQSDFESDFADYPKELNVLAYGSEKGEGFNGSNNWAVDKTKSESYEILLANDTHLNYSLPSLWYEMQLTNESTNVYGASFPGSPGIIIGHNEKTAWGVTNATMDVVDFYQVRFKDESFAEYFHDGEWKPTKKVIEVLRSNKGEMGRFEQVWTHHGIVVAKKELKGLVMQWTAHQPSNELLSFAELAKSKTFLDCRNAIKHFFGPAQNFICTDSENIGIRHNGKMAVKRVGQGKYIMDGSLAANDWSSYIPMEDLPQMDNPKRGYVFSANQTAVSKKYKHYLGWYYDDHFRGGRIREFLEKKKKHNIESMRNLQNDNGDLFAREILPIMLRNLKNSELSEVQKDGREILMEWNFVNGTEDLGPTLFYYWWKNLRDSIWSDQLWQDGRPLNPRRSRTLALIKDIDQKVQKNLATNLLWLDDINTPEVETLPQLVTKSYLDMWKELSQAHGNFGKNWQWYKVNVTKIPHLAKIPGFGTLPLAKGGSYNSPNANTGSHGSSWKMIVKLGKEVKAWTNISGGVSGNPMDKSYESFVQDWQAGKMKEAQFWAEPSLKKGVRKFELLENRQ